MSSPGGFFRTHASVIQVVACSLRVQESLQRVDRLFWSTSQKTHRTGGGPGGQEWRPQNKNDVAKKFTRDGSSRQTPSPGDRGQLGFAAVSRETWHRTPRCASFGSESSRPLAAPGEPNTLRVTDTHARKCFFSVYCQVRARHSGPSCEKHVRRLVQDTTGDVRMSVLGLGRVWAASYL